MLRQQVLTEWNSLKETIRNHQQYQWGRLLTNLGIRTLAPHLDLELITKEIKEKLNKSKEDKWKSDLDCLGAEVKSLKGEVNRQLIRKKNIVLNDNSYYIDYSEYKDAYEWLKTAIFNINVPTLEESFDDETGPTIEEVD